MSAMRRLWPRFDCERKPDGLLIWSGYLRPHAQCYKIAVFWNASQFELPYVMIVCPDLEPLKGGSFEQIPHLIYDDANPKHSGLCLFDPDGNEWCKAKLIAETTMFWTCEWLYYYEIWHVTGEWLGPSIGYESIAEIRDEEAQAIREAVADVH